MRKDIDTTRDLRSHNLIYILFEWKYVQPLSNLLLKLNDVIVILKPRRYEVLVNGRMQGQQRSTGQKIHSQSDERLLGWCVSLGLERLGFVIEFNCDICTIIRSVTLISHTF
jgi:hypothetical protein